MTGQVIGIYTRTSTAEQNSAMQLDEIRSYCAARGWENVKEYSDVVSGASVSRPALDRMLADVQVGRVNCVLVWKYDRMSRSLIHLIQTIDMLATFNCNFISIKENFDTTTAVGRCMVMMIGTFAEFERSTIRSRVKAGIDNAKKNGTKTGNRIGRPRCVFDRKLAEEMQRNGVSIRAIAENLKVSQTIVWRELKKC